MAVTAIDECVCGAIQSNRDILNGLRQDIANLRNAVGGASGKVLYAEETKDFADLNDEDEAVEEITVTGAALGDFVDVSLSIDVADLFLSGAVTAADTVTVQLSNLTGGAINLGSALIRVKVTGAPVAAAQANQLPAARVTES